MCSSVGTGTVSGDGVEEKSNLALSRTNNINQLANKDRIKRVFDIITSIVLLTLAAPAVVLIAIAVATDGGPLFYVHNRVGRGGRQFGCLKFRTMRVDAEKALQELLQNDPHVQREWQVSRKLRRDPRVTTIGRLLRKSSLDEIPQLFNVLAGDMSLVGPRPVVMEELLQHYDVSAAQIYLSVRPGLTGLWQVSGRSDKSYKERVALDCAYVETLSLWNDIRLLCRTIAIVIRGSGAY